MYLARCNAQGITAPTRGKQHNKCPVRKCMGNHVKGGGGGREV